MPCYKPLSAWRSKYVRPSTGKAVVTFLRPSSKSFEFCPIPCGQCIGCRLERSRQWAVRCVHESQLYEDNCFITLTFSPEHLNKSGSLDKRDFVLFMKRLRKRYGSGIRFFHCGEYGELLERPHHHACLFNFDFPDKKFWKISSDGESRLYISDSLHELWGKGQCFIGSVTFESAAYVARYILKKVTGDQAEGFYGDRIPEYVTMSRRPGIGRAWLDKFESDVYPSDEVILRGKQFKPPRYYDKVFSLTDPQVFAKLRDNRMEKAKASPDNKPERLEVRHKLQNIRASKLLRSYENG